MAMLPKTVGELRKFLETYPDDLEIFIQGDTEGNPNATPERFVVELWDEPHTSPALVLLAGISHEFSTKLAKNDPNASWNQPK